MMQALIVGMGSIGQAVSDRLLREGASVTGTYHRRRPEGIDAVQLDATNPTDIDRVFGELPSLDTLVVTTGHRHDFDLFRKQTPGLADEIVATELVAPMNLVRAALKVFDGFGRIVLIGSDSGKAGTLGDAASSAARAGLMGFVRSIARETAREDITINIVSPGPTESDLLSELLDGDDLAAKVMGGTLKAVPKGRPATAAEIAEAVAYFTGPNSGFTTGQVLSVSGGLTF